MEKVLDETERILSTCNCETSCYRCIRHYSNHFIHHALDRKLSISLLQYIRSGHMPDMRDEEIDRLRKSVVVASPRERRPAAPGGFLSSVNPSTERERGANGKLTFSDLQGRCCQTSGEPSTLAWLIRTRGRSPDRHPGNRGTGQKRGTSQHHWRRRDDRG